MTTGTSITPFLLGSGTPNPVPVRESTDVSTPTCSTPGNRFSSSTKTMHALAQF
ncbi:hypothetical protein [Massilia oculi]|uniref:hypothetical protein n=1 Tax=Massilia oculi TaxID=945844 RepID=UPI0028ACA58B|nr:hypothetical protein [Massilia oculi]